MPIEQYTYWSVTINNPDENDYLIVRNPNPKYIRECVWTPEVGEQGTEHIQAWVRLQRNQSMSFMKKIYPRGHFKPTDKDLYNENAHQYAQKNDETTAGNHHIVLNDPLPANDTLLYQVLSRSFEFMLERNESMNDHYIHEGVQSVVARITLKKLDTDFVERQMVVEKSGLEKIFTSPAYERMKSKYWREILLRLFKHKEDASTDSSQVEETGSTESGSVHQGYEEGSSEGTSDHDEGGSVSSGSSYDS